jgi:hypothetical protein
MIKSDSSGDVGDATSMMLEQLATIGACRLQEDVVMHTKTS